MLSGESRVPVNVFSGSLAEILGLLQMFGVQLSLLMTYIKFKL